MYILPILLWGMLVTHLWFCLAIATLSFIPSVTLTSLQKDHSINRIHGDPFSHLSGDTKQTEGNSGSFCCLDKLGTNTVRVKEQTVWRVYGQGGGFACAVQWNELLCWLEVATSPGSRTAPCPFQRAAVSSAILQLGVHVYKSPDIQLWGAFLSLTVAQH